MGEFFGTDGIRGKAGEYPLDAPTIERIGYSLTTVLTSRFKQPPRIVIGRDTRESGDWIEAAITRGIHTALGETLSAGVITTPGVAHLTRALGAEAGVVISASHNPYEDNGIKVFARSGQKLDDAAELAIEADLKAGDDSRFSPMIAPDAQTDAQTDAGTDTRLKEKYLTFLRDEIGAGLNLQGLKIAMDCSNGAAHELAPRLFGQLGASLTVINAAPNGRNINLECGSLHPEALQRAVIETQSDMGVAFDGDADRLVLVDERGQLVDGDQILFVMANYLFDRGKLAQNRVVATVMSNLGLELGLKARGISLVRASVGDKYVLEELLNGGGSIGGEQSGHIIFPEISLAGDGVLSALEVLRVIADSKRRLSDLTGGFTRYPQVTINVRVSQKPPLESIEPVSDAIAALEKKLNGSGRLLVRYSGTENLARVMIEGKDEAMIRQQAESIVNLIKQEIGC